MPLEFFDGTPRSGDAMWLAECASVARYCTGRGLDPGAGTRTLRPDTVRVDLFPEYQPHQVAQATALPFKADSFDYVFNAHLLDSRNGRRCLCAHRSNQRSCSF